MCFIYRVLQIILAMVSWLSTSYGVLVILHEGELNLNSVLTDPISIMAILILAILTFMAISWLNNILRKSTSVIKKTVSLIAYVLYITMSISFAYGFWWNFAIAKKDVNTLVSNHLKKAQSNILNMNYKVKGFDNQLNNLIKKANQKQQLENDRGGSCDNQVGDPARGIGPFFNSRRGITEHIELLRENSVSLENILNNLKTNLAQIVEQSQQNIKQAKQSELNTQINNFVTRYNNKIKEVKEEHLNYSFPQVEEKLNNILNAVSSSNYILEPKNLDKNQTVRHCTDNDLHNQLTILKKNLLDVNTTLSQTRLNLNIGEQSDRTKEALMGLYNLFVPQNLKYKGNTYPTSYFALALGVLVDFLLLFITIILFNCGKNLEDDIKKLLEIKYKDYIDDIYDVLSDEYIHHNNANVYTIFDNGSLITNGTDILKKIAKDVDEPQFIKEIAKNKKKEKILTEIGISKDYIFELNREFKNIILRVINTIDNDSDDDW